MNRRDFVVRILLAWASLGVPGGAAWAKALFKRKLPTGLFNPKEWKTLAVAMETILPSVDGSVSSVEAGGLFFLKKALSEPGEKRFVPFYRRLVQRLEALAKEKYAKSPEALTEVERFEWLTALSRGSGAQVGYRVVGFPQKIDEASDGDLFSLLRRHTIESYLASPVHGGNKDFAGWVALQHTCHHNYPGRPPSCPPHH